MENAVHPKAIPMPTATASLAAGQPTGGSLRLRSKAEAFRHIEETYPWLTFVMGVAALHKLALDIVFVRER